MFAARRAAAYQAWWEHMPVRIPQPQAGADTIIYRTGRYGDLLDLVLLDGRQFRSDQACGDVAVARAGVRRGERPDAHDARHRPRRLAGRRRSRPSSATWTVLGQQTVLTDLRLPNGAILN